MKTPHPFVTPIQPLRVAACLWLPVIPALRAQAPAGAVAGVVSNAGTGDLLEGVRVSLPALGLATLSDATGRYALTPVPAGTHEITASYTGLDAQRLAVVIGAGQRATRDFALTSGVYRLDAFTVAGEREGGAAAITAQRNAANVKNVVAMDSY
ncbi:MAG: carboxypeptidase regulatory-like domain-containing protein, partial [Opitutaceae bacterium]